MPSDASHAMRDRFLHLLKHQVLKLDLADLDFGVYRVLAHRREEIERFFDETLPQRIDQELATGGADRTKQLDEQLAVLKDQLAKVAEMSGYAQAFQDDELIDALRTSPKGKEYLEKSAERAKVEAEAGFSETEEGTVYAHLYRFFSRYYADGDFLPQPRRGRNATFSVGYQGEDVHFSWRGRGNHYVKTAEELAQYAFRFPQATPTVRVRFELTRADQEENNVKGKTRYFIPLPDGCRTEDSGDDALPVFVIPFEYRPLDDAEQKRFDKVKKGDDDADTLQQAALDEAAPDILKAAPDALAASGGPAELRRHLRRYARKNRTDYFVHPDLGGFLRAELDYFLKNEVIDLAALTTADALADRLTLMRVVQGIADDVIALLDQVETVQAQLFEKRKLVLRADYLAPVFVLPESLHAEIVANDRQREAWKNLFGVDLAAGDVEELKRRPTLVVDTALFRDPETEANPFLGRLLASFDDIDAALGGVLVHGDNYGALRTLGPVYDGGIKTTYIDPPYNTGSDDFLYKDDFSRHSTWLVMMEQRLRLIRDTMPVDGFVATAIDDNEVSRLTALFEAVFGENSEVAATAWDRNRKNDSKLFSVGHDYVLVHAKDKAYLTEHKVKLREQKGGVREARGWFASAKKRLAGDEDQLKEAWKEWVNELSNAKDKKRLKRYTKVDAERGPYRDDGNINWPGDGGPYYEVLHPSTKKPVKLPTSGWRYPKPETLWERYEAGKIRFGQDETTVPAVVTYLFESSTQVMTSVHYSYAQTATQGFDALWGKKGVFKNPKNWKDIAQLAGYLGGESSTIADWFAGSGPTAHAVIQLNRTDDGSRRFLLVDQGEYFDSVLTARTQKVMFSPTWEEGKPTAQGSFEADAALDSLPDWVGRTPRLVQVLRLESYEGSLNALETPAERSARAKGLETLFGEDYLLRYFLPLETEDAAPRLSMKALQNPFAYKLRVHTPDGVREQPVDLVETFPLVMGLRPVRRWTAEHDGRPYVLAEARTRDGGLVLTVWRPTADLDAAAEKAWLTEQLAAKGQTWDAYATVWMNATGALPKGQELDTAFKAAINARDPHVAPRATGSGAVLAA